jgi:hypothetical protein
LAVVSFLGLHSFSYATDFKEEKRVLVLFTNQSYVPAYPFVEKGIKSCLKAGTEIYIEYFIEYMDYYRNPDQAYNQLLLDLYHHKFPRNKVDLVIAYSAPVLSFIIANGNEHWVILKKPKFCSTIRWFYFTF